MATGKANPLCDRRKMCPAYRRLCAAVLAFAILLLSADHWSLCAQTAPQPGGGPSDVEQLAFEQNRLAEKYRALEQMMIHMAEFDAASNPQRAALLKRATQQSSARLIRSQLDSVSTLLAPPARLQRAITEQQAVLKDMQELLALLLTENRSDRLKRQRERIGNYIKEVERLIRLERSLKGETEAGLDPQNLADKQGRIAERAGELADRIREDEGIQGDDSAGGDTGEQPAADEPQGDPADDQPEQDDTNKPDPSDGTKDSQEGSPPSETPGEPDAGEGANENERRPGDSQEPSSQQGSEGSDSNSQSPPSPGQSPSSDSPSSNSPSSGQDAAQQRIDSARRRMQEAQQRLQEANRDGALEKQEQARRELELAKAELERILRQLREEEVERVLASLEERFRKMLESQLTIHEATERLDMLPAEERSRDVEIQASKLSFQQGKLVLEADKALVVLHDEGSSVAFPESVQQMRDDMQDVSAWLAEFKVGAITQAAEEAIIDALQEMIAALQQAQEDLEQQQRQQARPQQPSQPGEMPLVDQLAELKMIRALQMRVNKRTDDCAKLLDDSDDAVGQTENLDLRDVLSTLSRRQKRIYDVTRDIVIGKNR